MTDEDDGLRASRGTLNGCLISVVFWILILAFFFAWRGCPTRAETLAWDPISIATGYRVYWSGTLGVFCSNVMVDVGNVTSSEVAIPDPPPGAAIWFVVTAYNDYGESITGHGPIIECANPNARFFVSGELLEEWGVDDAGRVAVMFTDGPDWWRVVAGLRGASGSAPVRAGLTHGSFRRLAPLSPDERRPHDE